MSAIAHEVPIYSGSQSCCAFDNLRFTMRRAYYDLQERGVRCTHIAAGKDAILGYESTLQNWNDEAVTVFKGLVVCFDHDAATDEMHFMGIDGPSGQRVPVAVVWRIS